MNQAIRMVMNQAIPCLAYAPTATKRFRTIAADTIQLARQAG
ncbi:MAG: hypothetical protein WBZ35_25435 [Pseudolabrys sp.]